MNKVTLKLTWLILILGIAQVSNAQRLKDLVKKTAKGIEEGVTDKVIDLLAEELVERAVNKINRELDSIFQSEYKQDSLRNAENGILKSYSDFLSGMNEYEKVPEEYSFDLGCETLTIENNNQKTTSIHYYRKDGAYLGILSEGTLIVMDATNGIMVTYDMKEKTAFAFGQSMMQVAGAVAADKMYYNFNIEKTNDTQIILGYECVKYIGSSTDFAFETYIAEDFPVNIYDAYSAITKMFLNESVNEMYKELNGMSLKTKSTMDDGDVYNSLVTKVINTPFSVSKSEFNFNAHN